MEEEQYLLHTRDRNINLDESLSEEEWSEVSSDCSSYNSDTDSSVAEWESAIEENGQLLFIDCDPSVTQTNPENETKSPLVKNETRKSTRGKFLRLIRRRESKRRSKRPQKSNESIQENKVKFEDCDDGEIKIAYLKLNDLAKFKRGNKSNENVQESKVTFKDWENDGEIKTVYLNVNDGGKYKLGRRAKLVESILGINVATFSDGSRIMIAGFTPDSEAKNDKKIKIGDWLKSIDDTDVNIDNLNTVIEQLTTNEVSSVKLTLQRVTGVEVTKLPPNNELSNQSNFVKSLTGVNQEEDEELLRLLLEQPVGILYLNTEDLTESGPEFEGVLYCYPTALEKNVLCKCRGVFITINHLVEDVTKSQPEVTTVAINNRLTHVAYTNYNSKILLFMLPDNRITSKEIISLNKELIRILVFIYGGIEKCFDGNNKKELDHFFSRFFARVLTSGLWNKAEQSVLLSNFTNKAVSIAPFQFEGLLPVAHYIPLPNEAQMQIDDALSELEASDYREWNEDPLDCQRLFTILGSALYHSGYLLASHFVHEDLMDVNTYCRQQGLFHLSRTEPVRSMVHWREVFLYSCNRENTKFVVPNDSRRYLLIVGSGKDLLAVIMEAGGCTEPPEENLPPDPFYVEEAQATLAHLQELGISELSERWINSNPGSQVSIPQPPPPRKKSEFFFTKAASPTKENSPQNKKQEVTSILKRRNSDQGPISQGGSLFSIPDDAELLSEDSVSQGGYSERSEVSDEPVLGRRALRERNRNNFDGSDEEESDIEDYRDGSQISTSSYDISELRQTLLNETGDAQPMKLTVGDGFNLYHYVHLDFTEGILLSPPECRVNSQILDKVLDNFRLSCQHIHKIFQNTLRFKNMAPQEMAKSVMNKSLIAIKEYGILFETEFQEDSTKKPSSVTYWVIGRLFHMPHPQELYVCYQDSVPQNMIEIAFKLGLAMIGQ